MIEKLVDAIAIAVMVQNPEGDIHEDIYTWAIVNKLDITQVFGYVSSDAVGAGYKIALHKLVVEAIKTGLNDLNLKYLFNLTVMGNEKKNRQGGRIHIDVVLPDVNLDLLGDGSPLMMRSTTDNSYDCSTGLRFLFGASIGEGSRRINIPMPEKFNRVYHRHTKSLDVNNIEKAIGKGIEVFQTKMKAAFQDLIQAELNPAQISPWIDTLLEQPTSKRPMSKKYLENIKKHIAGGMTINNKWKFYRLVCQVLKEGEASIEVEKTQALKMLGKIKKLEKLESVQEIGGETVISPQDGVKQLMTVN